MTSSFAGPPWQELLEDSISGSDGGEKGTQNLSLLKESKTSETERLQQPL